MDTDTLMLIGIVAVLVGIVLFVLIRRWHFLAVCKRNRFTLFDADSAPDTLYGFTVTDGGNASVLGFEMTSDVVWNYFVLLNLPERETFFLSMTHEFVPEGYGFRRRRYRNIRHVYALAVKTEKEMPYVKIATHNFWDKLSFYFYYLNQPRMDEPEQPVPPGTPYKLYASDASPDQLQVLYDFIAEQSQFLKQEKLNIEISGKYIIFYKLSGGNDPCYFRDKVYPAALSLAEMLDK
ncbi:MAG: hypothetical protein FWF35_04545 [Elusimicrobia bacterium]|nr:hypothetical protein [Elusimicrobiota bacterium]